MRHDTGRLGIRIWALLQCEELLLQGQQGELLGSPTARTGQASSHVDLGHNG